jgi:hypothetical protein
MAGKGRKIDDRKERRGSAGEPFLAVFYSIRSSRKV